MGETQHFVARATELAKLDEHLDAALAGRTQVCLVTGSAGTGKTALLTHFAQRVLQRHEDLVVAIGRCDAYMGVSDPYLPFREVLSLITGDIEDKLVHRSLGEENRRRLKRLVSVSGQVLVERGPDLVGAFVPTAHLWLKVGGTALKKSSWFKKLEALAEESGSSKSWEKGIDQPQIFEQYANVVGEIAQHTPLIIALDDLQWSDDDSVALLFRLARRLTTAPVLIIGAYRADELAPDAFGNRHALEKATSELKRYFGDVNVDLDKAVEERGFEFVREYLNADRNHLAESFYELLYQHTGGHPLFTEEVLQSLRERRNLIRDSRGYWVVTQGVDLEDLPARVEGALAERLQRLDGKLLQALELGSVQGDLFIAEIIADLQNIEPRSLVRQLSGGLQQKQHLVESVGVTRIGSQRISSYQFAHKLIRTYLYGNLDVVERVYLHEDIGNALESLYGERADEIAGQLAYHFERAELRERAGHYLQIAGKRAAAAFASQQAIDYSSRALAVIDEPKTQITLLFEREQLYDLQGRRREQRFDLQRLEQLAMKFGDLRSQVEVALRYAWFAIHNAEHGEAVSWAKRAVDRADDAGEKQGGEIDELRANAHLAWGDALRRQGDYGGAKTHYDQALALAQSLGSLSVEAHARRRLGLLAAGQGDSAVAESFYVDALRLVRELGDRRSECSLLNNLGMVVQSMGDHTRAVDFYQSALQLSRTIGHRRIEALALTNLAAAFSYVGQFADARKTAEQALEIAGDIESEWIIGLNLTNLAETYYFEGNYAEARRSAEHALALTRKIGDRVGQACSLCVLGNLTLVERDLDQAEQDFAKALDIWLDLDDALGALDAEAGLALTLFRKGGDADLRQAESHALSIVEHLGENPNWEGGESILDLDILFAAYRVLDAVRHPAAESLLQDAHARLYARADKIGDEQALRHYLHNFEAHRELRRLFDG